MSHSLEAIDIYRFLSFVHQQSQDLLDPLLLSLRSPRFGPVSAITARWYPTISSAIPELATDFQRLISAAESNSEDDAMLRRVADHYPLIYRVSCFLETDDQVELFIRCLSLDRMTSAEEIKPSLFQFLNLLESDTRQCIERVLVEDPHGYLSVQDCTPSDGFLDLDRLSEVIGDSVLFEQVMATIQSNAARGLPWIESVQQIYELVRDRGLWEQLAPILQQVITDPNEYSSYEEYVQKNFLDDGGQQYLDQEIDRTQVEFMLQNLKM